MKWVSKLFKSGSNGGGGNHHPPQFQEDENMVFPLPPSSLVIIFFYSLDYLAHILYRHVIINIKAIYKRRVNITTVFFFYYAIEISRVLYIL